MAKNHPPARRAPKPPARPQGAFVRLKARLSAPPRRSEPSTIAAFFALATLILALAPFINAAPPVTSGYAPDFTMTTTTGGSYALSFDLGSRPVMLEFMHPDCSHCQAMGPTLQAAHDDYGTRVRFVTVAIKLPSFPDPTIASVSSFASNYGHGWTYGVDRGTDAREAYGIQGTPTIVFIRQNGTIAQVKAGELSLGDLEAALAGIAGV